MTEEITALSLAQEMEEIYHGFTDSVRSMGSRKNGKSRLGTSVVHWMAGSHVKTERDILCDQFLQDVQRHLQTFDYALEGISEEEAQAACEVLADIMTEPLPAQSNSTTVLMKRAMIGQLMPYLGRLSTEKLAQIKERMESSYRKSQRLPVEREVLKELERLLKEQ